VVPHQRWYPEKSCPHILLDRPGGWDAFLSDVRSRLQDLLSGPSRGLATPQSDAAFQMGRLSDFPSRADLGPELVAKDFVSREAVEEVFEFLFGHLRNLAGGRG
jgi:hypothetical protein